MKRIFGLVLVLAVFSATAAFGAPQQFGSLVIDIPDGWTATPDGTTVGIVKDDNSASMSVTLETMDGATIEELAAAYAQQLNGTTPEKNDEGDYLFTFNNGASEALLSADGSSYLLIVVTGAGNAPDELQAIVRSISMR